MERFDPEQCLALIERYRVTHAQFVPTMFVRMLKLPEDVRRRYDLSSLVYAVHAAAPCPVPAKRQMLEWWGPIIHEYYSGTEDIGSTWITPEEWIAHPGSVGRPVEECHIVGDDGEELPPGGAGTIYFAGGRPFEYHNDPGKTSSVTNDRGWRTLGDVGYLDADGYLFLTDRQAHMIISGGVNIYPQEAENVLSAHPAVDRCRGDRRARRRHGGAGQGGRAARHRASSPGRRSRPSCSPSVAVSWRPTSARGPSTSSTSSHATPTASSTSGC